MILSAAVNQYRPTLRRVSKQEGSKHCSCTLAAACPRLTPAALIGQPVNKRNLTGWIPERGIKGLGKQLRGIILHIESAFRSRQQICVSISNHVWTRKIWQDSHQGQVSIFTRRPAVPRWSSSPLPSQRQLCPESRRWCTSVPSCCSGVPDRRDSGAGRKCCTR